MASYYMKQLEEILLPSGSFKGPDAGKQLRNARCIMFLFYFGYTGALLYTIYLLIFSGKIEVYTTAYKVDIVEAPSVAVCPFWPGAKLVKPQGVSEDGLILGRKYGTKGKETLKLKSYKCTYDRECMCTNLYDEPSGPVVFKDYVQAEVADIGLDGKKSELDQTFRERIEVFTNLTDPSPDKTLKIGFFDSIDKAPQWFYMTQGVWVLGSLELQTWTVSDFTWHAIKATAMGDHTAMFKSRHIFRYTSQEVGERGAVQESFVWYEMKNFFVDDTISSETAFSPYALLFLCFMIAVRSAVVSIFTNIMFPEYDPKKDEVPVRELGYGSDTLVSYCGCCCCWPAIDGRSERAPLLGDQA